MLLIPCPWCGERDESEFTYGGSAEASMPALDGKPGMEDWHAFVHARANPKGRHREYWHHTHGCERWLIIERDTVSHAIGKVRDAAIPADDTA